MNGDHLAAQVSRPLGAAIAVRFAAVGRVRGPRALHPQGVLLEGTFTRAGQGPPSGISWVDAPGVDPVVARLSRSAGLPRTDTGLRFDAVRSPPPGSSVDAWARTLREASYAVARDGGSATVHDT